MSVLSQFAAGGIKSVQRGVVVPTSTNQNVTIPVPVNTGKAFLSVSVRTGFGSYAGIDGAVSAFAQLLASNTINIQAGAAGGTTTIMPTVSWEVIEFY